MKIRGIFSCLSCILVAVAASVIDPKKDDRLAFGAEKAKPNEFPYEVSIQHYTHHSCGGALISLSHVLTAAHCLTKCVTLRWEQWARDYKVWVGLTRIGEGHPHEIRRIAYRRDYDAGSGVYMHPNDIGVITLKTPVVESVAVKVINLPPVGFELEADEDLSIAGWGNGELNTPGSKDLQKTWTYSVSHEKCHSWYRKNMHGLTVLKSQICAQRGPGYNVCQGDSGSPLVYKNMVVGVVSTGTGECKKGHPDLYTKVSHYLPFIKAEMNFDFKNENKEAISMDFDKYRPAVTSSGQSNQYKYNQWSYYPTIYNPWYYWG